MPLRQKIDQTWEKGAAERRNWSPSQDDAHYRIYKWWMSTSGNHPTRENFCHYWRVVLIWGPLRWAAKPLLCVLLAALIAFVVWLAVSFTNMFVGAVISVVAIAYVAGGTMVGKQFLHDLKSSELDLNPVPWLEDRSFTIRTLLVFLTAPVLIVLGALGLMLGAVVGMIFGLEDEYKFFSRAWRWFFEASVSDRKWLSWIQPWSTLIVFGAATLIGFSFVNADVRKFTIGIAVVLVALALIFAGFVLLSWTVDTVKTEHAAHVKQRAEESRRATFDMLLLVMFDELHGVRRGDQQKFEVWRSRYMKYSESQFGAHCYDVADWRHINRLRPSVRARVTDRMQALLNPPSVIQEPSRMVVWGKSSVRNVGDILSLVWSVILTKKWKICPWVELPEAA